MPSSHHDKVAFVFAKLKCFVDWLLQGGEQQNSNAELVLFLSLLLDRIVFALAAQFEAKDKISQRIVEIICQTNTREKGQANMSTSMREEIHRFMEKMALFLIVRKPELLVVVFHSSQLWMSDNDPNAVTQSVKEARPLYASEQGSSLPKYPLIFWKLMCGPINNLNMLDLILTHNIKHHQHQQASLWDCIIGQYLALLTTDFKVQNYLAKRGPLFDKAKTFVYNLARKSDAKQLRTISSIMRSELQDVDPQLFKLLHPKGSY